MLLVIGLIMFFLLVVLHEYGHFLVARRNGVDAEEFGIGFPPKVASKTMGKGIFRTEYSLNLLPIGGFVRLKGENDSDTRKGSFGAASLWVKTKIALAGVAVNWVVAALIFTYLAATGMPQLVEGQFSVESDTTVSSQRVLIGFVEEDSPASRAGIEFADELVSFNGERLTESQQLFDLTESNAGQTVQLEYVRDGETFNTETTLNAENSEQGFFGVTPADFELQKSTWSAPIVGVGLTAQFSYETVKGLGNIIVDLVNGRTEEASESVAGPVGIYNLLQDVSTIGAAYVFFVIAIISLTLAVMNSLPIPALDGGRMFVTYLFRIIRKPLTPKLESAIHGTGMVVLLALIVLVTYVDITR